MDTLFGSEILGRFTHWCETKHVETVLAGKFKPQTSDKNHFKPHGVWISWNNGWEEWCKSEWPSWMDEHTCLKVRIHPRATIAVIDSLEDLQDLMKIVGFKWDDRSRYSPPEGFWEAVKETFDGVALTDRGQWKTRLTSFMYGWDCSSICMFYPEYCSFELIEDDKNGLPKDI